jgi:hypothetical protein
MRGRIIAALAIFALPLFSPTAPLAAQEPRAEDLLQNAQQSYGPAPPKPKCNKESQDPNVIVVCAELEKQEQFRVRTDEEAENDYARETMNKGRTPAPNVDGDGIFKGPATFGFPPPPPALIIDLEEIPDAPAGSDAARIGTGEKGS